MVDFTIRFACHAVLSHGSCGHHPLRDHPLPALCHPGGPSHPHLGHLCGMGLPDMVGTRLWTFPSCNGKGGFFSDVRRHHVRGVRLLACRDGVPYKAGERGAGEMLILVNSDHRSYSIRPSIPEISGHRSCGIRPPLSYDSANSRHLMSEV